MHAKNDAMATIACCSRKSKHCEACVDLTAQHAYHTKQVIRATVTHTQHNASATQRMLFLMWAGDGVGRLFLNCYSHPDQVHMHLHASSCPPAAPAVNSLSVV